MEVIIYTVKGANRMYKTIAETAVDLGMPEDQIMRLVYEGVSVLFTMENKP